MKCRMLFALLVLGLAVTAAAAQNKRDTLVKKDRKQLTGDKNWIYNDLSKAMTAARAARKPLLVVFR